MKWVDFTSRTCSPPSWISASSAGRKRTFLNRSPIGARQLVHDHAAEVVPGVRVPIAGIAQSGDEPCHGLALATLLGGGSGAVAAFGVGSSPSSPSAAFAFLALGGLDLDTFLAGHRQVGFDAKHGRRDDRQDGVLVVGEDRDALRAP